MEIQPECGILSGMVEYELTLVLKPDVEEKQSEELIKSLGGKVTNTNQWGKRMLAYPIKKYKEGLYIHVNIELKQEEVKNIEQALNIHEDVIRYLLIKA